MDQNMKNRITIDDKIMLGKPVITGTRITIELIVKLLAKGLTPKEIMQDYPKLKKQDIQAALLYASDLLNKESVYSIK